MRKSILSLALVFVFSSLASAAEHFSFASIDLSLTPQQVMNQGIKDVDPNRIGMFSIQTTVEPEKKSRLISYSDSLHSYEIPGVRYIPDRYNSSDQLQKIFSLPKEDMKFAGDNIERFVTYCLDNSKIENDRKLVVDDVKYHDKQSEADIVSIYITMPGFKQRPLLLFVSGKGVQYVPDVFNQRYGQSNKMILASSQENKVVRGGSFSSTELAVMNMRGWRQVGTPGSDNNKQPDIYWENDKEFAVHYGNPNDYHLIIVDKEAYKTMMQFVAQEVRRIAAEQKAGQETKQKAVEKAIKGKI